MDKLHWRVEPVNTNHNRRLKHNCWRSIGCVRSDNRAAAQDGDGDILVGCTKVTQYLLSSGFISRVLEIRYRPRQRVLSKRNWIVNMRTIDGMTAQVKDVLDLRLLACTYEV